MGLVLGGGNPLRHIAVAYVNRALILACVLFFVLGVRPEPFAFVPAYLFGIGDLAGPLPTVDAWRGLFGHVLIHGDALHLLTNMVALWVFGDSVEDALGHVRYGVFFFLCAAAGAMTEGWLAVEPLRPVVGASGAISGVMGAYLLLHPHAKILLLLFFRIPLLLPASVVVGGDLAANVAMVLLPPVPGVDADGVAWGAHLGGFAAGMLLVAPFKRRGVPLFLPADAYPAVPFPRLQRVIVDIFPGPRDRGDGERTAAGKAVLYFGLVAVLVWTL
ncbi:rhomboid family intramembrane serine protease [Azospirillum sp. A39]|uniref:rhomboid family intramembrane serine protease n=1 Tax=Azospirillum sp. A39 TaxID=3462279 RepID=UPI004046436F